MSSPALQQAQADRDRALAEHLNRDRVARRYADEKVRFKEEAAPYGRGPERDAARKKAAEYARLERAARNEARPSRRQYEAAERRVNDQIANVPDALQRKQLRDDQLARKADVHLEGAGVAKTDLTRQNARVVCQYGEDHRMRQGDVAQRIRAIDMHKPVTRETVSKGTVLTQEVHHENVGKGVGKSFSTPGHGADRLGIAVPQREGRSAREHRRFEVREKLDALKFTPSSVNDTWSERGRRQVGHGGGTEYYIVDKDRKAKLRDVTDYRVAHNRRGEQIEVIRRRQDTYSVVELRKDGRVVHSQPVFRDAGRVVTRTGPNGDVTHRQALDGKLKQQVDIRKAREAAGKPVGSAAAAAAKPEAPHRKPPRMAR